MSKVTLSAVGLSPQEGTVVNVVANLLVALDYSVRVLNNDDVSGDIVLIGHASQAGRDVLTKLGKAQRAVLFVDNESDAKGYSVLTRPVRVQTLRDLLVELMPRLPEQNLAATQTQQPPHTANLANVSHAAAHHANLFYLIIDAVIDHAMVRIEHDNMIVLVHGPTQCVYTNADSTALAQMSAGESGALHAQRLSESDFMRAAKGMPLTRLHDVIWLAARHGSRGVLLDGHSLDVPVRLKVWPKFNSRHVRTEYLKLAALLARQPLTLRALAQTTGVTLAHVIDFYNTAVAFGVIEKMEKAPVVIPPPKAPSNNGGLLGKIAKRLALKRD